MYHHKIILSLYVQLEIVNYRISHIKFKIKTKTEEITGSRSVLTDQELVLRSV